MWRVACFAPKPDTISPVAMSWGCVSWSAAEMFRIQLNQQDDRKPISSMELELEEAPANLLIWRERYFIFSHVAYGIKTEPTFVFYEGYCQVLPDEFGDP